MIQVQKQNERELVFPHIVSCETHSLDSCCKVFRNKMFIFATTINSCDKNAERIPFIWDWRISHIGKYNINLSLVPSYFPLIRILCDFFPSHNETIRKHLYKNLSFLNNNSKNSNRENLNFASQLFSDEKSDIISVKRKTLRSFPKSATPTSFNLNIKRNFGFCSKALLN